MFEEAADDGAHLDPLGYARHAGPQAAQTAHDEVDIDAGARSSVQSLDDDGLGERVKLRDDAGGLAGFGVGAFALDAGEQRLMQAERRMQQLAQARHARESGQLQEYLVDILAD